MSTVYGIGDRDTLSAAAASLALDLNGMYAATQEGFATLRSEVAAQRGMAVTVLVAPRGEDGDRERLVMELLRLEAAGATLVGPDGNDPLQALAEAPRQRLDARSERARKIRETMSRKAMRGLVLGRIPYGYQAAPGGSLQEAPGEAEVVREIFQMAAAGKGIRAIVKELNGRGLRTRRDGPWSMITVRDMLRNRVYAGTYDRFGSRVTGNHPALVSPDAFKRVQERLNAMARRAGYGPGAPFLLSGTAVCGACGSRMIGVTRRQAWTRTDGTRAANVYRYYQCEAATNQSRCSYHTRRTSELDAEVLTRLGRDAIGAAATAALDARLAALTRDATSGRLSIEDLREQSLPLQRAADDLVRTLTAPPAPGDKADSSPFAVALAASDEDASLRLLLREAVRHRVERVVVGTDSTDVVLRR